MRHTAPFPAVRRWLGAALLAAIATDVPGAQANEPESVVSGTFAIEEGYTDNVKADAVMPAEAFFTDFRGEVIRKTELSSWLPNRYGGFLRGRLYSDYSNRHFAEFGPSLGYDWDRMSLTVEYQYSPHRLRVDPAATADAFADVHHLPIELRSRFGKNKRWTALLEFDSRWEFYDPSFRERTFFQETIEAGLRCRATKRIAPRASAAYAIRDAIGPNFDREEVSLLFGFDVWLPASIRGLFRYEATWRNFLVGSPADPDCADLNNCGREDDAYHVETGLDVPVPWIQAATFHIRYDYRDNASSRRDRSYTVNEASLGLSYDF